MISKNLLKALEERNFTFAEGSSTAKAHAYAVLGGYFVTVYEYSGKKVAYFNFKFAENEENSVKMYTVSESFSSIGSSFNVSNYSIDEDGLRVYFSGNTPEFIKLLDKCIEFLTENEIRGVGYCSMCGNKFGSKNPKKVTLGIENHLMCDHCALETVENIKKDSEKKILPTKKEITHGTLSSIGLSLLGVAIYFVVYFYLSPAISNTEINDARYIFCALGSLVAFLAYIGYRIGCKTSGMSSYIVIGINSLFFTAIGQYLGVVFEFIAKSGLKVNALSNKAFWLVHIRNTIPEGAKETIINYSSIFYKMLAISLMFAIVGAAIFLLTLHDKTTIKKEAAEVETIKL